MAIFRNRPLALACILLIFTVAVCFLLPFRVVFICAIISLILLAALCLLFKFLHFKYYQLLVLLTAAFIALGAIRALTERHYAMQSLGTHIGEEVTATFEIEEIYKYSSYGSLLGVRLNELNGSSCHLKALLVTTDFSPLYLCDKASGTFVCQELWKSVLYEDQAAQFVGDGIYIALTPSEDGIVRLEESGNDRFLTMISDFRELLHFRLTAILNQENGELLSALLLGTRDSLSSSTVRDFRRIGISHLLALSGLHLTILLGISDKILSGLRVGKRWRVLILMLFSLGYLLLTGFSYSMLRAVLMLTLLQISFFVKEDYDAFTALCAGGAFMLLLTPYAIFDLSFQMTMLATFGILSFGNLQARLTRFIPRSVGWKGMIRYLLRAMISSLLITLSATVAILPMQWLTFGEISLLAPIANLLMIPLATLALLLGLILLVLLPIPAAAGIVAVPTGAVTVFMLKIASALSPVKCMLSLQYSFVPYILIPFFVITAILLIVDLKRLDFLILSPSVLAVLAFSVCLFVSCQTGKDQLTFIYRNTESNEGILLIQNGTAVVCDVSNGSYTQLYENYHLLQKHCATEIKVLMLTHYHERHITSFSRVSDSVLIRSLWVPPPTTPKEKEVLARLLDVADSKNISVTLYSYNTPLTVFGSGSISVSEPLFEKRSVEPAFTLDISFGEKELIYQSAAFSEYQAKERLITGDYLILGSHGPVPYKEIVANTENIPEEIVIGNENVLLKYKPRHETRYILYPNVKIYILE